MTLTPSEQRVIDCVGQGRIADFSDGAESKPTQGYAWGSERTVRCEVVQALVTGTSDRQVRAAGVVIKGARIAGELDLRDVKLDFPLVLCACFVERPIILDNASAVSIRLTGSCISGLRASGLLIAHDLFLDGVTTLSQVQIARTRVGGVLNCMSACLTNRDSIALDAERVAVKGSFILRSARIRGEVVLVGAKIESDLECSGASFDNRAGRALSVDRADISGGVYLRDGLSVKGEVGLAGCRIGGNLDCANATFENYGGVAICADAAHVAGAVEFREVVANGQVRLVGARIRGDLSCVGGSFENPDGNCLSIERAAIGGDLILTALARPPVGTLNLSHAKAGRLLIGSPESWPAPGCLVLDGFKYDRIAACRSADQRERLSARDWLAWIERQGDRYLPQPFEELIRALRSAGNERESREVAIAKKKALRRKGNLPWWSRVWNALLGATVGHGYKPWLVAFWLAGFIIGGAQVFRYAKQSGVMMRSQSWVYQDGWYGERRAASRPEPYPPFDPYLFSVDTLVPFVNLHQQAFWWPNARRPRDTAYIACETYLVAHELIGWTLFALLFAALGGFLRRD